MYGRALDIKPVKSSDQLLEIHMTNEKAGIYFVRLNLNGWVKVFRIIKT